MSNLLLVGLEATSEIRTIRRGRGVCIHRLCCVRPPPEAPAAAACPPSCRSQLPPRRSGKAPRKPPFRPVRGNPRGSNPGHSRQSIGPRPTTPQSSDSACFPSSLGSFQRHVHIAYLVRLGVIPKRSRYCDRFGESRMDKVAMASPPATVYEAGALELRDKIANLGWHTSKTRSLCSG